MYRDIKMQEYQYWIILLNIICSVCIISLAWNTSYWIKDKINRFLVFIVALHFYKILLTILRNADYVIAHQLKDTTLIFIADAIQVPFLSIYSLGFACLCLLVLIYRLGKPLYLKFNKGELKN